MNCLSEGYKRAVDKLWGPMAKNGFQALLNPNQVLPTTGQKSTLFPNRYQSLTNFACFWGKKHFSAKRKKHPFSVNPAGTKSVVVVGYFVDGPDSPTKFR